MGVSDDVTLEAGDKENAIAPGTSFDTKSLYANRASFTITRDGQLVEHLFRYHWKNDHGLSDNPPFQRIPMGTRIIAYHGDILLYGASRRFVARFTNGRLEWIRPLDDYPEENRVLLIEQGAR